MYDPINSPVKNNDTLKVALSKKKPGLKFIIPSMKLIRINFFQSMRDCL